VDEADASALPGGTPVRASSLATRSPRRGRSRSISGTARRRSKRTVGKDNAAEPADFEEVTARAAHLGITVERVLQEYARIAFADLRHIVKWGPKGLELVKPEGLSEADVAPIHEISADGEDSGHYRVKLYDKKAALDAIARHLGMFLPALRRLEDEQPADPAEDAREELARRVARLVAGSAARQADPVAEPEIGGNTES
jgi:hypothetical protein